MTVWPGPIPQVNVIDDVGPYRLEGDLLRLDLDRAGIRSLEVPPELYLRGLRDIDLADLDQILEFVNTHGRLGHRGEKARHEPLTTSLPDRQIIRLLNVDVPHEKDLPWDDWYEELDSHPHSNDFGPVEKAIIDSEGLYHIDTFRGWAEAFRKMTDIFHAYQDEEAKKGDVLNLSMVLESLLEPFSPTIQVHPVGAEDSLYDPFEDRRRPRLENLLALQLYQHIAAGDIYRRCDNETCGRLFIRQSGRSAHGQYRTKGVMYCSNSCAKAQASRQYRRKRRANGEAVSQ